MRIVLSIDGLDLIGGSERYAALVAEALAERGHAVTAVCARSPAARPAGVEVLALPETALPRLSGPARETVATRVAAIAPDVIYALSSRSNDLFALLLELAPVVRHVQDHTLFCPGLNKMHESGAPCVTPLGLGCLRHYWLDGGCSGFKKVDGRARPYETLHRLAARRLDLARHARAARLVVASRYMRTELARAGIPSALVAHVPYFTRSATPRLPEEPPPEATRAFVEGSRLPLLFTPARLVLPDKGVDHLLTALAEVRRPFRAVIAGDGPAREWLVEKARAEGVSERVHFSGWLAPGAIEWLYARAAAVPFPSVWDEPFGLVGLEAMAHAKPVVAFDVGGVPDWLDDGGNGYRVPRRDTHAMAGAIDRLLGDPELRGRLGANGRERAQREFSPGRHLSALETILALAADRAQPVEPPR